MVRMVPKMFIMLPVLILLLFAVIAVIVLFIKLCSKRPWIVVIMALGLLFLIAPILWLNTARRSVSLSIPSTLSPSQETTTAIWLPGIEDEFEANIYPSKLSAVRSLGLRIDRPVQQVLENLVSPARIILFQGAHNREFVEEFGQAIKRVFPETNWTIKPETAAVQDNEVAIRLDIVDIQTQPIPWRSDFG